MTQRGRWRAPAIAAALLVLATGGLTAHETKIVGALRVTIGWADEPAYTAARNAVVVRLADNGGPLRDPAAALSVEIGFGDERLTLPLEPAPGRPDELRAWIVPTRAGTYTFHVTGKVGNQPVDVTSTCSERTFHCVAETSLIQFPAKDPSSGELAERLGRALPRADAAISRAARAQQLASGALAVAAIALVAAGAVVLRTRRPRM